MFIAKPLLSIPVNLLEVVDFCLADQAYSLLRGAVRTAVEVQAWVCELVHLLLATDFAIPGLHLVHQQIQTPHEHLKPDGLPDLQDSPVGQHHRLLHNLLKRHFLLLLILVHKLVFIRLEEESMARLQLRIILDEYI